MSRPQTGTRITVRVAIAMLLSGGWGCAHDLEKIAAERNAQDSWSASAAVGGVGTSSSGSSTAADTSIASDTSTSD